MVSGLNMSHGKCLIVSFPLLWLTLVAKLKKLEFQSHWNALIFSDNKMYDIKFEYVPWKNDKFFLSFSLFEFTFIIKLKKIDFESHWNTLSIFDKERYDVRFAYIPQKNGSFYCLGLL